MRPSTGCWTPPASPPTAGTGRPGGWSWSRTPPCDGRCARPTCPGGTSTWPRWRPASPRGRWSPTVSSSASPSPGPGHRRGGRRGTGWLRRTFRPGPGHAGAAGRPVQAGHRRPRLRPLHHGGWGLDLPVRLEHPPGRPGRGPGRGDDHHGGPGRAGGEGALGVPETVSVAGVLALGRAGAPTDPAATGPGRVVRHRRPVRRRPSGES